MHLFNFNFSNNPAFNKEVFVDFMGAQIKTLSFLAYIIRIYQEEVGKHSALMAEGMLGMLQLCPMEVTHLRKDLFIAARHILATELRISKLFSGFYNFVVSLPTFNSEWSSLCSMF